MQSAAYIVKYNTIYTISASEKNPDDAIFSIYHAKLDQIFSSNES